MAIVSANVFLLDFHVISHEILDLLLVDNVHFGSPAFEEFWNVGLFLDQIALFIFEAMDFTVAGQMFDVHCGMLSWC